MPERLLNPQTRRQLEAYLSAPAHAIIFVGPNGSGKLSLALQAAETLLSLKPDTFGAYPYGKIIKPPEDKSSIGIEEVRALERFLGLKVPSRQAVNRVIIVEEGQFMTVEAQNALLKTLEEPPAGTVIIITASGLQALLPTIRSRAQQITVKRPAKADVQAFFASQGLDASAIDRAYAMSGGLPGLMQAILSNSDHPLLSAAQKARELLSQTSYERLAQVEELARQRGLCLDTLRVMQQMAAISLQNGKNPDLQQRWQGVLEASYRAVQALEASGQPKLVLCDFLLRI